MISWGTQDRKQAIAIYHLESDSHTFEGREIREKWLTMTLPYRRTIHAINRDAPVRSWLKVGIWWHKHAHAPAWFVRFGVVNG